VTSVYEIIFYYKLSRVLLVWQTNNSEKNTLLSDKNSNQNGNGGTLVYDILTI